MDQELEYAQMLEVPVSTVSVVKKKPFFKKKAQEKEDNLKEQVVDSVNERMGDYVYSEDLSVPQENKKKSVLSIADKPGKILIIEVAAACLLAIGIFLTNVFMPTSAINTFISDLTNAPSAEAAYTEFDLFPVDQDIPLITARLPNHIHTEENLHQGALAGAIFAHKPQDLSLPQCQVDIRQDLVAEEILFDIAHLQQRSAVFFHSVTLPFYYFKRPGEEAPPAVWQFLSANSIRRW